MSFIYTSQKFTNILQINNSKPKILFTTHKTHPHDINIQTTCHIIKMPKPNGWAYGITAFLCMKSNK